MASAPACTARPRNSCCTPLTYNRFIQGLHLAGIELDRRALAEIAVSDPDTFKTIVDAAKAALPEDVNAPVEA